MEITFKTTLWLNTKSNVISRLFATNKENFNDHTLHYIKEIYKDINIILITFDNNNRILSNGDKKLELHNEKEQFIMSLNWENVTLKIG